MLRVDAVIRCFDCVGAVGGRADGSSLWSLSDHGSSVFVGFARLFSMYAAGDYVAVYC